MALIKPEQLRSGSYTISGSFSGSFFGDGSGLTNLSINTGSFTTTSSFNSFTSSYYIDSSSFSTRVTNLENFSSSLDATFATDAELNAATASLSASISYLSSSFETFSGSYNTGSFTGSFTGSLQGTASWANNAITASYVTLAQTASYVETAQTASYVLNAISSSYALQAVSASYASNSLSASFAQTSSLSLGTNIELTINGTTQDLSANRTYTIESIMYGNPNDVIPAGLTRYYGFSDVIESTVEINRRIVLPRACTFSKFYILTSNVQPATGGYVITILKNGVATSITVTIPAGSLAGQYTDLVNSVFFAAGDGISIQVVNNAIFNSANIVSVSILYI